MGDESMRICDVAVLPGDRIGREVMPPALAVLEAAGKRHGFGFQWTEHDRSCDRFHKIGAMMADDAGDQVKTKQAIMLGAVGAPSVPDHVSLWGMLIPLRRELKQYACLRPVRLLKGIKSPLADRAPGDNASLVVRENVEGAYSKVGGHLYEGTEDEVVVQDSLFTRRGVDRIITYV